MRRESIKQSGYLGGIGGVRPSYVSKSHTFCVADDPANGFLLLTLSSPPKNPPKSNVPLSCTITISPYNPSEKRSIVLYNHNISNPPVTENVPLSCISTICPSTRQKKKSSTVLYNHTIYTHPVTE